MSKTEKKPKITYNVRNTLVSYYLLVMFTFFPIFLTDQFARARTDKFVLFTILSAVLIISVLCVSLSYISENKRPSSVKVIENVPIFKLSVTDYAFFAFAGFAAISTLFSDHKLDSLTGNAGRNNGLVLILLYLCVYFIVSRFVYYKEYVLIGYLVFSSFIALLAVINYFYIDPFGLFANYSDSVIADFGTTIGNKNTIASFMCLFLPVAVMLFVTARKKYMKILAGFSVFAAFSGLLVADSNSGYLGFIAVLAVMLLFCIRKYDYLRKYMLALVILFSSGKLLRLFSYIMDDDSKGFEKIADFFIYNNKSYYIIAVALVFYLVLLLLRGKTDGKAVPKFAFWGLIAVFAAIIGGLVFFTIKYTFIDSTSDIGYLAQFFRFNDKWGTHRGFMWINGMKEYANFNIFHLLFGSGPDTFYYVFESHFPELLSRFGDSSTDCIHSEYLNYLVTQGALGLLAYLTIIISTLTRAIKKSKENPFILLFVSAIICYCVQSVVNIYQPITTPTLFLFVAICEAVTRDSNPVNRLS